MAGETEDLKAENERLKRELAAAQSMIRRAKDINPVERPSLKRVLELARDACLDVQRVAGGWELSLGQTLKRRFRFLKEIWEILLQESWSLSDIFRADPSGKPKPRLPRRYPVLAPWLPFPKATTATDRVDTSAPAVTEEWCFDLY